MDWLGSTVNKRFNRNAKREKRDAERPSVASETEMTGFRISLPARAENVAVIRHACGGLADVLDLSDPLLSDIKLAVTEACTNVVVHAYPEGSGDMDVSVSLVDHHLEIVVADDGAGILPRADSPGLGLGLPLIATLATSLELSSDERTEVRISFALGEDEDG
jgi:anti-sigma regulatory factor (Ser/Thr protein kinase)